MAATLVQDAVSGTYLEKIDGIIIFTLENATQRAIEVWQDSAARYIERCQHPPCLILHDFTSPRFTSIPYAVRCVLESYETTRSDIQIRIAMVVPQAYYNNILKNLDQDYQRPPNIEEMLFWKKEHALHWLEEA